MDQVAHAMPYAHQSSPASFLEPSPLALFFMRRAPQWVQDADPYMRSLSAQPYAPVAHANPFIVMKEIDRLQGIVRNLEKDRAAGRPHQYEKNWINYARDGLQAHLRMCREQRLSDGTPIAREHLSFLNSYTRNAVDEVESIVSKMEKKSSGKASLDTLPAHADLLTPDEKESFELSFAILNSILQDKSGPLSPADAATLKEAASNLERLNKQCEHRLAAHVSDSDPDNPASLLNLYDGIDQFQSALDRTVREAIGNETPVTRNETPVSRTPAPEGLTDIQSFDQSLGEIRRLLGEGQTRRLSGDEDDMIQEHFENLGVRLEKLDPDSKATAEQEKEDIRIAIENYKASRDMGHVPESMPEALPPLESSSSSQNRRQVTFKEESEGEEDIYNATPRLSPRPLDTRTRNFGRGSISGMQSSATPPIPEMSNRDPHAPPVIYTAPSRFSPRRLDAPPRNFGRGSTSGMQSSATPPLPEMSNRDPHARPVTRGFSGFAPSLLHSHSLSISPLPKDDESIQPSRSLRGTGRLGRSSVKAADTASLLSEPVRQDLPPLRAEKPSWTSNRASLSTRRASAEPSTSTQRIGEADNETEASFSLLRPPAMLEPLPALTPFQTRTGTSDVNGPVNNDLRRLDSILSQPVRDDLQTTSREEVPARRSSTPENLSLYSSPKVEAQSPQRRNDDGFRYRRYWDDDDISDVDPLNLGDDMASEFALDESAPARPETRDNGTSGQ